MANPHDSLVRAIMEHNEGQEKMIKMGTPKGPGKSSHHRCTNSVRG